MKNVVFGSTPNARRTTISALTSDLIFRWKAYNVIYGC